MSYTRETWVELASTDPSSTPITAIRLNNIEAGIENSHGRSLVTTARDLLVSSDGNLFTGRVIWNSTLSRAQWYNGSTWVSGSGGGESPADVTKSTSVEGSSLLIARANHKHNIQTTGPVNISTSNAESTGTALARAGHIHNHPSGLGTGLHHPQAHEANHRSTGNDALNHANLGIGTDDHHPQGHTAASHSDQGATGAELETLTDGSNADALHAHAPSTGAAKAYCSVAGDGTLQANSLNITSTARNSLGNYTITIATDFSNANWVASITVEGGVPESSPQVQNLLVGAITIVIDRTDTQASFDLSFHFVGHGDQ